LNQILLNLSINYLFFNTLDFGSLLAQNDKIMHNNDDQINREWVGDYVIKNAL